MEIYLFTLTVNLYIYLVTQNFTVKPDSQMILYHYDVIFNCTSDGIPKPRIHWMFQNKAGVTRNVENTGGKYKVSNGRLTITMVDYSDEGEYVCVSISPRLKTNVSAKLDVYGKLVTITIICTRLCYWNPAFYEMSKRAHVFIQNLLYPK